MSKVLFLKVNSTWSLIYIGYWRRLWSSDDFVGQPLANCVGIIHADIIGTWNLPDTDKVCLLFSSVVVVLIIGVSTSQARRSGQKFLILFRIYLCLPSIPRQGEHKP